MPIKDQFIPYFRLLSISYLLTTGNVTLYADQNNLYQGKVIYDYYCYQCHGYAGNADTLASTYLSPKPRNFTQHINKTLPENTMRSAIIDGRKGTAMVSFRSVLNDQQVTEVIDYIQNTFMNGNPGVYRYHTKENGWPNHDRYRPAFAFVNGKINPDTADSELSSEQQYGRNIFLNACVSCHDRTQHDDTPVWQAQPVSYPRNPGIDVTYENHQVEITGASPYSTHDQPQQLTGLSTDQKQGQELYQSNCAFCHAADGTGKNWIGSFMHPPARNLTRSTIINNGELTAIKNVINNGLPNTSMPAWRDVLTEQQKNQIISYLVRAFKKDNP